MVYLPLFDSIIWKDVAKRHNIRNISDLNDLNDLALYLLSNFCNPLSANDIAKELSFTSVTSFIYFILYIACFFVKIVTFVNE